MARRRKPSTSVAATAPVWPLAVALVALTFAAYGPLARNGFVGYDDPDYVTENAHVRAGLSPATVSWAFDTGSKANWHPLTWISHALDVTMFGLDPAGHHLVSLAIHAVNAVLLLLALHAMTASRWRSAMVAALFAVHPLHVESVAWVAERKDVLSTLFGLAALLAYTRHAKSPATAARWPIAVWLALSLMAKPMWVSFPLLLLVLDLWPLGRSTSLAPPPTLLREKVPLFVLSAASCVVTVIVQHRGGTILSLTELTPAGRLANATVAYAAYLGKAAWPLSLAVLYPIAPAIAAWKVLGALAIVAAVSAGAFAARATAPYLMTGWLWYVITLLPVIGIVQVGVQSMADRYTYFPLVGLFVMAVWGAADLARRFTVPPAVPAAAGAVALVACAVLTWRQVTLWRDSVSLFEHTLSLTSDNYVIECDLGAVLVRAGRIDEGLSHLEAARRIRPGHAPTLMNLGVAAIARGRLDEAESLFRAAVAADPRLTAAQKNLRQLQDDKRRLGMTP